MRWRGPVGVTYEEERPLDGKARGCITASLASLGAHDAVRLSLCELKCAPGVGLGLLGGVAVGAVDAVDAVATHVPVCSAGASGEWWGGGRPSVACLCDKEESTDVRRTRMDGGCLRAAHRGGGDQEQEISYRRLSASHSTGTRMTSLRASHAAGPPAEGSGSESLEA